MKKILILSAIVIGLVSCEKKTCWKCTIQTAYSSTTPIPSTVTRTQVCDKTKSEIREYEKQSSASTTQGNITVRTSTSCVQE